MACYKQGHQIIADGAVVPNPVLQRRQKKHEAKRDDLSKGNPSMNMGDEDFKNGGDVYK